MGKTVFRLLRLADDVVAGYADAGVVTKGKAGGKTGVFFQVVDMGDVVEVDDGAEGVCFLKLVGGRIVRCQHDFFPRDPRHLGEAQLRQR